jgi:hypothetical protein
MIIDEKSRDLPLFEVDEITKIYKSKGRYV